MSKPGVVRRLLFVFLGLSGVGVVGLASTASYKWYHSPGDDPLPKSDAGQAPIGIADLKRADQVKMITARIYEQPGGWLEPIPEFTIAPRHFDIIVGALAPAKRADYPALWDHDPIGRIKLITKAGNTINVVFCNAGQNPLCFSVDGVRYTRSGPYKPIAVSGKNRFFADEAMLLYEIIREIQQEQKTHQRSNDLSRYWERLQRSKGMKPPE